MNRLDTTIERQQFWNNTLESMGAASEVLSDQLERVGEPFPELVGAFTLLVAYIGHLHEQIEKSSALNLPMYDLPASFCVRNPLICKSAHGDESASKLLGGELVPVRPEPLTCDDLWAQYLEVLARERSELIKALQATHASGKPLQVTDAAQFKTLITVQRESDQLRAALWERKCALPSFAA